MNKRKRSFFKKIIKEIQTKKGFAKKKKTQTEETKERVIQQKEKKHGENNSENALRKKEIRIVPTRRADMKRRHKRENKIRRKSKENEKIEVKKF